MIYLSILMISNIYAQCDDYSESQCNNDNSCEWVEDIEIEYCDGESEQECLIQDECSWDYTYGGYLSFEWYYSCNGYYEIDNGYCQEVEMDVCSEMNESECSSDDVCEWVEDIEIGQCSQFDNSENSCTDYPGECYWDEDITYGSCSGYSQGSCNNIQGCYWDCSNYYNWDCGCYGQEQFVNTECIGQYEINNSYCEEIPYELGDLNQDSIINIQDIIIIINLILNAEFDLVADINLDSTVNVLDVIQIVNIILNN